MTTDLAAELRSATRTAHEQAEAMPFVSALMAGRVPLDAYVDLLTQHHAVYAALEAAEPFVRADPAGATLLFDALARSAAIEHDLAVLRGPTWRATVRTLPATQRYVDRLRTVAGTWVGGYAAHAYTRYLGDLSGGVTIRGVLRREYGLGDDALHFYAFPGLGKPKPFKDLYRARLDALPWDDAERARVAAEAGVAFGLNADVFADLGAVHLP
ncbi:biliverdin-producing heme oxygenase [Cellulomonas sp. ATA003]|uniref:biliverdin-producing heme oxygenase n=1 Tax=Cellulomonas sp. ATA003 TaxID=3073064 RepID=UPI002872BB8A|nr:biliverdin-producing heme oxygenase [Cellulomonas sp. ATA003]WNB86911.1 biliverdin-producing heme oxygenase [Cellulomonas sp. ATA003]